MQETILIIDEDVSQLHMKEHALQHKLHYGTVLVNGSEEAVRKALAAKSPRVDLALLDLEGLSSDGLPLINIMKALRPDMPVIVFTPYGEHESIVRALQAGVYDFLTKPVTMDRLRLSIRQALKILRMSNYISWLERKVAGHVDFSDMVGQSPMFKNALAAAQEAASTRLPVCIEGETGTGKELLARAVHGSSDRAGKPCVVVNCDALPEARAEAILFGQDKGLQVDAPHFALGKVREAEQGTLILKEVASLPLELQRRLLKAMETGFAAPLGGGAPLKVNVRLICTVNAPAGQAAMDKMDPGLRQYLRRFVIHVPPLSGRKDDILRLAEHFLAMYAASENKYIQGMTERAVQWLGNTGWPGNVTQLSNVIWRAAMLCDHQQLDATDLQMVQKTRPVGPAGGTISTALIDEKGQVKTLKSVEEEAIRFALQHTGGCMMRAAKSLGIGRSTLYRKVTELEIEGYISRANQTTRPTMTASSGDRS